MNYKHPFRIGRLIKISPNCDLDEMEEYFNEIKYKVPVVDGASFPIPGDPRVTDALITWIEKMIQQGHTGWFCMASTPVPEIVKGENCVDYSWKRKYWNRFYGQTLEELELIVQKWADEIYQEVANKLTE
ncbi:MAG: hypothetical protein LBT43_07460 [Prevotella sp.]|jgi:CTP:phosphocholine cytidylyltransferase-like protein|nr:hypothetical protein [Prevotella sp.]